MPQLINLICSEGHKFQVNAEKANSIPGCPECGMPGKRIQPPSTPAPPPPKPRREPRATERTSPPSPRSQANGKPANGKPANSQAKGAPQRNGKWQFPRPPRWMDPQVAQDVESLLLEAVRPNIFRTNAFRMTGLSVDVSEQELRKQAEKIRMMSKYGQKPPAVDLLPLDPPPDAEGIEEAIQRIRERPECLLIDQLFWFWPLNEGEEDEALAFLTEGRILEAQRVWLNMFKQGNNPVVALHNIGVLCRCMALDLEFQSTTTGALSKQDIETLDKYWKLGNDAWKRLLKLREFWEELSQRIERINHTRLKTSLVEDLRQSLPILLTSVNGQLAVMAGEENQSEEVARQRELIDHSGLVDTDSCNKMLRWLLEPQRNRVASLCEQAEKAFDKDARRANKPVQDLQEQTAHLISTVTALLGPSDSMTTSMCDEVGLTILSGSVSYGNETEDWETCDKFCAAAEKIAVSDSAKDRIRTNRKQAKENAEGGNSWVSPGYYQLPEEMLAHMEKAKGLSNDRDHNVAIGILTSLLKKEVVQKSKRKKAIIKRALSYALNRRALDRMNAAVETYQEHPPMLSRMIESPATLARIQSNQRYLAMQGAFGSLDCTNCNTSIHNQYIQLTIRDIPIILCPSCGSHHRSEVADQKTELEAELIEAHKDWEMAQKYNPGNKVVKENLEVLFDLAEKAEVDLDSEPSHGPNIRTRGRSLAQAPSSTDCFIATAAWGTPMADEVQWLREFRDKILCKSAWGRGFINLYYFTSPPIAWCLSKTEWGKAIVRWLLQPIVTYCRNRLTDPKDS